MNIGRYVQMYSDDLRFAKYAENTVKNYSAHISSQLLSKVALPIYQSTK